MTRLLRTRQALDAWLQERPATRGVVLTMGALHDGHMRLVDRVREEVGDEGTVLVTVFVNPTQFGPNEDFAKYPRTLDADLDLCAQHGVDAVFAPEVDEVYPSGEEVPVPDPGTLATELEGAIRPGHFAGVLQVVYRLLQWTAADVTCFGEKDYQQLALVRRMARDLLPSCRIVGVPIVRDADGLAMSSRNRYLTQVERANALAIPHTIHLVQQACADGYSAQAAALEGFNALVTSPGISVDYVVVRDVDLGPAGTRGEGRVLIAARVGSTRLLDNAHVMLGGQR